MIERFSFFTFAGDAARTELPLLNLIVWRGGSCLLVQFKLLINLRADEVPAVIVLSLSEQRRELDGTFFVALAQLHVVVLLDLGHFTELELSGLEYTAPCTFSRRADLAVNEVNVVSVLRRGRVVLPQVHETTRQVRLGDARRARLSARCCRCRLLNLYARLCSFLLRVRRKLLWQKDLDLLIV